MLTSQLRLDRDGSVLAHNVQLLIEIEARGSKKKLGIVLEDSETGKCKTYRLIKQEF
jgi:hypothetical protein